jgi:hypothetical protein
MAAPVTEPMSTRLVLGSVPPHCTNSTGLFGRGVGVGPLGVGPLLLPLLLSRLLLEVLGASGGVSGEARGGTMVRPCAPMHRQACGRRVEPGEA